MHQPHRRRLPACLALLSLVFIAADWKQFRGPAGSGVSDARGLLAEWNAQHGILWQTALPGYGASSPIVLGNRVFLTCYSGYGLDESEPGDMAALRQHVVCYDLASGEQIWDTPFVPEGPVHDYQSYQALHGYASSTLVADRRSLYFFFGRSGVGAMSLDGQLRWRQSVGTKTHGWGSGTSPVLYENLVIVNASVESGALVAVDKNTGQEVWRAGDIKSSWNTPALVKAPDGSAELVVSVKNQLLAFDPASGEKLWWCDSFKDYVCPSVIAHDGVAYAIGARRSSALAVKAGGRGDVTESHRLWDITKGSNVSSPVYFDGYLYWAHHDRGIIYCVDAKTGQQQYEERLTPRPGRIFASPVVADGKIYFVSREQGVYVVAARPEFELLAHNEPLDDAIFNGSPAVVAGKLLMRSDKFLYCIGRDKGT